MNNKAVMLVLVLVLCVGSLFAVAPGSWLNASLGYSWMDSSDALGLDLSWTGFPGRSWVGLETRAGLSFSLEDSSSSFVSMFVFLAPAFSVDFTEGILGYVAAGPSYIVVAHTSPSTLDHALGVGIDVGARFRLLGSERWDLALVGGAFGNLPLVGSSSGGSSLSVSAYLGFSSGSSFSVPRQGLVTPFLFL